MNNILISTECVADLPVSLREENHIDIIYYDIRTDGGVFRDTDEIDSQNIMEYMVGGKKKAYSVIPTANDYRSYFNKRLREYDEIIHICISGGISEAYNNALLGRAKMGLEGNRVYLIDSRHLSGGQALVALEAVACKNEGMSCKEIVAHLQELIPKISTTFLAENLNYLYYNGKVKKAIMDFCNQLMLHPVLSMEDGKLTVKRAYFGKYRNAAKKYIRNIAKNSDKIDAENGFLIYSGGNVELLEMIKETTNASVSFENLYCQQASATISCNCGPNAFGILYVRKK